MPHFTLTSALSGMIPAAILYLRKKEEPNVLQLGIAIAIGRIITSIILVPYFLHILFALPWTILIIPRLIAEPINVIIYTFTISLILKRYYYVFSSYRV
jgi:ECF transporter S component (folate family)